MDGGAEVAEGLNEWENIQSPITHTNSSSSSQTKEWELAVLRDNSLQDNYCSVFPPSRHEGLQITTTQEDFQTHEEENVPPSSSASSSPAPVSEEEELRVTGEVGRCLRFRFEILRSGIFRLASTVCSFVGFRGGFLSVTRVVAAAVVLVLYLRVQRWRRRLRKENQNRLIFLAKEKDEKISQLLLQVAQMNELLSTRRRVPVLRIKY